MTLLAIIFFVLLIICGGSILGWILNIIGYIISFIFEGFCHLLGCFAWIIIMAFVIGGICSLF